jgi:two-component system CheB/CheR fusion protein
MSGEERRSLEATSEEVSYLAQAMPYRNRHGECLGAIVNLTDVSEQLALRRAAEASLREFSILTDALDQVVWKRDRAMQRILYISQRIQRLTGWSTEQLCFDPGLFDGAILVEDRAAVEAARRNGAPSWRVTFRLRLPDGRERAFEEVATVLDDSNNDEVVGTLSDVTEARLMERRNALLARAFQELQASETHPIALLDESLIFISITEAFASCFGRTARELLGQSLNVLDGALTLLLGSDSQAPSRSAAQAALRQLIRDVIQNDRSMQEQPVLLSRSEKPGEHALLNLIPLGESGEGQGVLLQLMRPAA